MVSKTKKLYQGQPAALEEVLYTVPTTALSVELVEIVITNTTVEPATISLSVVSNRLFENMPIADTIPVVLGFNIPMAPGDFISCVQGTANALTVTISGEDILSL